jgi:alkylhydroperoxidase family enzyme
MDLATRLRELRDEIWEINAEQYAKYETYPDEFLPNWIASLPDEFMINGASYLYHAAFENDGFPASLKHLGTYLVTHASGYPNLATEEKRLALQTADDAALAERKLAQVEAFAKSRDISDLIDFDEAEVLVIRFAECSIEYPNVIPGQLVYELSNNFTGPQIGELISTVAFLGFAQRWTGIWEPLNDYMLKQSA